MIRAALLGLGCAVVPAKGPPVFAKPIVALSRIEFDAAVPLFVLYADGNVLVRSSGENFRSFAWMKLAPKAQAELLAGLPLDRVGTLAPPPSGDIVNDGVDECIDAWVAGVRHQDCAPARPQHEGGFDRIWQRLARFAAKGTKVWDITCWHVPHRELWQKRLPR